MNCDRFHEDLGELGAGRLDPARSRELLAHASGCDECGAVLAMEEVLVLYRDHGAPEHVPQELVDGMWERLRPMLGSSGGTRATSAARRSPRPSGRWVRIAIAGLLAGLFLGGGYLLGRLDAGGSTRLDAPREPVASVQATQTRRVSAPGPTASALLEELAPLPGGTTAVPAREAEAFLRRFAPARRWLQETRMELDIADGVQVGELRQLLETLPPDTELPVPSSHDAGALRRWLKRRA